MSVVLKAVIFLFILVSVNCIWMRPALREIIHILGKDEIMMVSAKKKIHRSCSEIVLKLQLTGLIYFIARLNKCFCFLITFLLKKTNCKVKVKMIYL